LPHFGQVPVTNRSAKNWSAFASYNCSVTSSIKSPLSYNFLKILKRYRDEFSPKFANNYRTKFRNQQTIF
jgi:hypothetical protein